MGVGNRHNLNWYTAKTSIISSHKFEQYLEFIFKFAVGNDDELDCHDWRERIN